MATENPTNTQWIITDPSGARVNQKLLSESEAATELEKLNTKALNEGKGDARYSKRQYLVG